MFFVVTDMDQLELSYPASEKEVVEHNGTCSVIPYKVKHMPAVTLWYLPKRKKEMCKDVCMKVHTA